MKKRKPKIYKRVGATSNKPPMDSKEEFQKHFVNFKVLDISSVNHKPHPYVIGPSHVSFASDNYSGMLSENSIREGERRGKVHCYHGNCRIPYDEHTSNKVLFLQLKKSISQEDANLEINNLELKEHMAKDGIDGFVLVETPEKFRIN